MHDEVTVDSFYEKSIWTCSCDLRSFYCSFNGKADGAGIFNANCVACHAAGGNTVNPGRTLQQEDLKSFLAISTDGEAAIVAQVTNGKSPMPSFNGVLIPNF